MSTFDIVPGNEVRSILAVASGRRTNIAVSAQYRNRWLSFLSHMVQVDNGRLLIEVPTPVENVVFEEAIPGQECSLNFRLNNHRYFFVARLELPQGGGAKAISMPIPGKLERQDRRVMDRVDVPSRESVRATAWASPNRRPIWTGRVLNMNIGGFQMTTPIGALNFFETGDRVAVELSFGPDAGRLTLEAHHRYGRKDGNMAMLGMEFTPLNLNAGPEVRETLGVIVGKIEEFRKAARE